ncbi:hypothetical protein [Ideonella margarita]|uniref:Uncharacterized protein n=1 Tax=Ideonella margarita TaxID=2984191 RepID=A0ABU9C513_9BURK
MSQQAKRGAKAPSAVRKPRGSTGSTTARPADGISILVPVKPLQQALRSSRFLALERAGQSLREIASWDEHLLRDPRLLVPVDVQALVVPPGHKEPMVRLPLPVVSADGQNAAANGPGMPPPFDTGTPRPAGVHLHWAMPDALLRGRLDDGAREGSNRLALPPLPDRWVVLRTVLPRGARVPVVTGWVLEADRAVAVPLGSWREGGKASTAATPAGEAVHREALIGTAGGSVAWSGVYDAVLNRFAFHDTLEDLDKIAPGGVDQGCVSYLVAGWWSDPTLDPLGDAGDLKGLSKHLDKLRWSLPTDWGTQVAQRVAELEAQARRDALGLTTATFDKAGTAQAARVAATPDQPFVPRSLRMVEMAVDERSSAFIGEGAKAWKAPAWHLRSSLLHGVVVGVPVGGKLWGDLRPAAESLSVAMGQHDDDVLAALAARGATPNQQRATERLLAAFTSQRVNQLGSADGLVNLEEGEHAAAFFSQPAGSAGNDRFKQLPQGRLARAGTGAAKSGTSADAANSAKNTATANSNVSNVSKPMSARLGLEFRPDLASRSHLDIEDLASSRIKDALAAFSPRVVDRPAARWTAPTDPMVAVRGASRSLRHGHDGRGSSDRTLGCRWPSQVVEGVAGVADLKALLPTLDHGGLPPEVLKLAREMLLFDPYHLDWLANAVATGDQVKPARARLDAELLMRFGADGVYDGSTAAFSGLGAVLRDVPRDSTSGTPRASQAPAMAAAARLAQRQVAEALRPHSLFEGMDPDLVAITNWQQPWVPLWLEWQVHVEGLDPPTLAAWQLGAVDLQGGATEASVAGEVLTLTGRSLLTGGAATTLHAAISDWLAAEDQLDASPSGGQVDEATEEAYRALDASVQQLDVLTASLDGLRHQLLGFVTQDGLRRPGGPGNVGPAPQRPPASVWAGALTLRRARLLDAFGRTLEVPAKTLGAVAVPSRSVLPARPGRLGLAPRLLRPARWLFRLVDAATPLGAEGVEARVDQIEPALAVNPVVGFLMPDHLDESIELFGADGAPLGELLHEPISGGVMWEAAPGRPGPVDAGPLYGLKASEAPLGLLATGLVAADAAGRADTTAPAGLESMSALSALLRAIDTSQWTVDSLASLGTEHVAGLVGRPLAVVRAQLRLELKPPTDVDLSDPTQAVAWAQAEEDARRHAFEARIGELTRSDDGVLGYFVNDDFSLFHVVDKVVASQAAVSGKYRGHLGLFGKGTAQPQAQALSHPYLAGLKDDDALRLHLGQTVTLTVLMHPGGKCHLTSGILPRKALALARDWVSPGLSRLAPSLRTGPVLVETDLAAKGQVRLPKVSVFGQSQNFLWRDTPASWRTDAILSATQTALLPDEPGELREGWVRVAPEPPEPVK